MPRLRSNAYVHPLAPLLQLLDVARDDRLVAAFVIAISLGLRRGELLGLRWPDVDLDTRTLHVVRAVQRSGGKLRVVEPKTRRSRRRLPLPLGHSTYRLTMDTYGHVMPTQMFEAADAMAQALGGEW